MEKTQVDLEFTPSSALVELEAEQIQLARQQASLIKNKSRRWHVYLQSLALTSLELWLQQREPLLRIKKEGCSVFQLGYANFIDAVCNLEIGKFRVCLLPTVSWSNEEIIVPRAIIDLPELTAHFYVIIAIEDELELATIRGFASYDKLQQLCQQLEPDVDWNYPLCTSWFNPDPDKLLLYWRCWEPSEVFLPEQERNTVSSELTRRIEELKALLPQVETVALWQFLTWEQGKLVLSNPDLVHWCYRYLEEKKIEEKKISWIDYLGDLLQILTRTAVNASSWFQEKCEQQFWQPVTALSFRGESRTRDELELDDILQQWQQLSTRSIPVNFRSAYRDYSCWRLYGVSWSLEEDEWSLLLVLGAIPGGEIPYGCRMRLSDRTGILWEGELREDLVCLDVEVSGSHEEEFLATVVYEGREEVELFNRR